MKDLLVPSISNRPPTIPDPRVISMSIYHEECHYIVRSDWIIVNVQWKVQLTTTATYFVTMVLNMKNLMFGYVYFK